MKPESTEFIIRKATQNDLTAILEIVNFNIANTTSMYDYEPRTLEIQRAWLAEKREKGLPVIVAEWGDSVCGFGTYGRFRAKIGYQYSMEHSVYVDKEYYGRGIGSALLDSLIKLAIESGYRTLIAGIDAANERSIRFHSLHGFEQVARFREVGYKFGRWLDLVFMQLMLDGSPDEKSKLVAK